MLCEEGPANKTKQKLYEQTLFFQVDGVDDLKKVQLMELAMIKGTFRDNSSTTPTKVHQQQQGRSLIWTGKT